MVDDLKEIQSWRFGDVVMVSSLSTSGGPRYYVLLSEPRAPGGIAVWLDKNGLDKRYTDKRCWPDNSTLV